MRPDYPATSPRPATAPIHAASPLGNDPQAIERLQRGIRMAVRVAVASCRALAIDEPDLREVILRAGVRAIAPDRHDSFDRTILPATYRRLVRLELYIAAELEDAISRSGITACDAMSPLIGQAAHVAIDELPARVPPHVARDPAPSRGLPRDEHGRFVASRAARRHPATR